MSSRGANRARLLSCSSGNPAMAPFAYSVVVPAAGASAPSPAPSSLRRGATGRADRGGPWPWP
eukprot:31396-Pelagococcus_subviridis.AAC.12